MDYSSYDSGFDTFAGGNSSGGKRSFNLLLLIGALIGAVVGFILGEILVAAAEGKIHDILLVGIYFAQLIFFIFLAVLLCEKIEPRLNTRFWTKKHWRDSLKRLPLMSILVFFVAGCLFQFLYGLSPAQTASQQADDYIFVIDNSGSTSDTDPQRDRFSSVASFVNELDESNQAAVIVFSNNVDVTVDLGAVTEQFKRNVESELSHLNSEGGTDIQSALLKADDLCSDSGRNTMVILLSDGESSVNTGLVTDKFQQKNIVLNTVGYSFNQFMGTRLLAKLSSLTGGMHYEVSDMQQMAGTLTQMLTSQVHHRNLLSYRLGFDRNSTVFMILRILFIALLTVGISFALGVMLYNSDVIKKLLYQKIAMGITAGLIMEFGLFNFMPELLMRFFMALLMGILITFYKIGMQNYSDMGMQPTIQDLSSQTRVSVGVGSTSEW